MAEITLDQQIEAVKRSVEQRQIIYPRMMADRLITPVKAAYEIAAMEKTVESLRELKELKQIQINQDEKP